MLAVAALLVYGGPLDYLGDLPFHPWALAKPSLMAHWRGTLTTGHGERLIVTLSLVRARTSRGFRPCAKCNQLEGTATTCDARGDVRTYRVAGSPTDRHATNLVIGSVPTATPPPDGLELSVLQGRWERPDALVMNAEFHWRRGSSASSSTGDPATRPVPIRLERDENGTGQPCGA